MERLIKTFLWSVAGIYLLFRSYQGFQHPSLDSSWFTPYPFIVLAGLAFFYASGSYRQKGNGPPALESSVSAERLTGSEKIIFKALGLPVIFVGMFLLGLAVWLAWGQWTTVAHWPRTNAILISKDISSVGARLVFQYEAGGKQFTGFGFRWGSERKMRETLEAYMPGTIQKISYDPEDPTQVGTILAYNWELFISSISAGAFGVFFIAAGIVVYRWSYDRFTTPLPNCADP